MAEANRYGTPAYKMLMDCRSKGFSIIVRQSENRRACPTRLKFRQMRTILSHMDYAEERLEQLQTVIDAGKGQKNPYEYVRKWFLTNYPNFDSVPTLNDNNTILAPRLNLLPEASELKKSA